MYACTHIDMSHMRALGHMYVNTLQRQHLTSVFSIQVICSLSSILCPLFFFFALLHWFLHIFLFFVCFLSFWDKVSQGAVQAALGLIL